MGQVLIAILFLVIPSFAFSGDQVNCAQQTPSSTSLLVNNLKGIDEVIAANTRGQNPEVVDVDFYVGNGIQHYSTDGFSSIEIKKEDPLFDYGWKDAGVDAALWGGIFASRDQLPEDKFKHLATGAAIGYAGYTMGKLVFKNAKHRDLYAKISAFALAALAGAAKEAYDSSRDSNGNRRGHVELNDFLATAAGGSLVALRFNIRF